MILLKTVGEPFERLRALAARGLARLGVRPDVLTLAGLPLYVLAGALYATGHFHWAVGAVCVASACDLLDGAVARLSGQVTESGAFLDSVVDRYSDAAVFGGVVLYYLGEGEPQQVILGGITLVGALVVSYARARAESVIPSCKVGFMERPERLVLLMIGTLFHHMLTTLWVLAVLTHWTAFVRIRHTRRTLAGESAPPTNTFGGFLWHVLFWDFDRGSLAFDVLAALGGLACVFVRL